MKDFKAIFILLIVVLLGLSATAIYLFKETQGLKVKVGSYLEKQNQLVKYKKNIKDFYKEKLFKKIDNFNKKVPLGRTLVPLRAMREVGAIIREEGARGQVLYGVESKTKDTKKNSSQNQQTQKNEEKTIEVGKEKVKIAPFQVELKATYNVLLNIFERISNADVLTMVYRFKLERTSSSSQFLNTELTLAGFLSQDKETEKLKYQKSEIDSFSSSSSYPRR
ncbi:MAG: hypothetical protein K9L84_03610 [Candidatus Omnitrophica bacterium]|nr:hypothetical protein [Candidatus Omnitrophota bacterium]MCF7894126.1 hypothetical protein [Candidatus Omnitrophota bacterium]